MTKEKWQNIIGNIKDNFKVEEDGKEHLEQEGGVDIEFIIFNSPLGRVRLELVCKPVILDKKTTYSKRIGAETKIDYVYSEDEKSSKMIAYKWSDDKDEWEEFDGSVLAN